MERQKIPKRCGDDVGAEDVHAAVDAYLGVVMQDGLANVVSRFFFVQFGVHLTA